MIASAHAVFWHLVTRFGEVQIVLPALVLAMGWMLRKRAELRLVLWWSGLLALAGLITLVTKVAFIGFGIGVPVLNFTGVSGHAMCAAVVFPLLARLLTADLSPSAQRIAVVVGAGMALLVGVSRLMVDAHSPSEVFAGLLLGGLTSSVALALANAPAARLPLWLPLSVALWLGISPIHAPASQSHNLVTRLSLAVSGRDMPYTRDDMLHQWRVGQPR